MGSIWHALAVVGLYLYFVIHLGPKLMRNRPAFKLEGILKAYNLLQVALNLYMLYFVRLAFVTLQFLEWALYIIRVDLHDLNCGEVYETSVLTSSSRSSRSLPIQHVID
jgi:hypothetical protein